METIKAINETQETLLIRESLPVNPMLFSKSVSLLQQLIKTPSYSGDEARAADLVQQYLESYSIKTNRKGNNVWCYNKHFDAAKPTILLNSHMDTVKPNDEYTNDPFCP
jgi:acetylornithine deacetylase